MDDIATIQEEQELTPEQKKVLGQVYRLILSWDCEAPEVSTPNDQDSEKAPNIANPVEANPTEIFNK